MAPTSGVTLPRRCLDCSARALPDRSRCAAHSRSFEARRPDREKYRGDWPARARLQVEAMPYCGACGATTDLTAEHLDPEDPSGPLTTLCRSCNSSRRRAPRR